jgi:hypothetical protein
MSKFSKDSSIRNLTKSPKNMKKWLILGQKTGFLEIKPGSTQFQDPRPSKIDSVVKNTSFRLGLVVLGLLA